MAWSVSDEDVVKLALCTEMTYVFKAMGYLQFGVIASARDKRENDKSSATVNALHYQLIQFQVFTYQDACAGLSCKEFLGNYKNDNAKVRACTDFYNACKFMVKNYEYSFVPKEALKHVERGTIIRIGGEGINESSHTSIRTHPLPLMKDVDQTWMSWFLWKDSTLSSLRTQGLVHCVEDSVYAYTHAKSNSAVDGLITTAMMGDTSFKYLDIITDTTCDGDGYARWQRLIKANECDVLIHIILKDLEKKMRNLLLKDLAKFDEFSGKFHELKNRLLYMFKKSKGSTLRAKLDNATNYELLNWKDRYISKIKCRGLEVPLNQCDNNANMTSYQAYMDIKCYILLHGKDESGDETPRRSDKKRKHSEPDDNKVVDPKKNNASNGKDKEKLLTSMYSNIKNSDYDEATKKKFRDLVSQSKNAKSVKKNNRRRKSIKKEKGSKNKHSGSNSNSRSNAYPDSDSDNTLDSQTSYYG